MVLCEKCRKEIVPPPVCDNCGNAVPPVFEDGPPLQIDGGLVFNLQGHYGGFVDLLDEIGTVILCNKCCQTMWAALPGLAGQVRWT